MAATGLLLAAGLAACGSGSGTGDSSRTFTYWTSQWQPAEIAAVDAAFTK